MVIEQARVNDEVWLPQHIEIKVDARLALLMGLNMDLTLRSTITRSSGPTAN